MPPMPTARGPDTRSGVTSGRMGPSGLQPSRAKLMVPHMSTVTLRFAWSVTAADRPEASAS